MPERKRFFSIDPFPYNLKILDTEYRNIEIITGKYSNCKTVEGRLQTRAHLETLSRPADQTEVLHLRQRQPQTAASHNQTSSLSSCSSFFCSSSCSFCSSYCCSCSALQRPHRAPSVQAAAPQMRFAPLLSPVAANYCHPKPKISV